MITTLDAARTALAARLSADDRVRQACLAGDHWQAGAFWSGPRPAPTEADAQTVLEEIKTALVVRDALNEVLNRHVGGVIGRAPSWRMLRNNQEVSDVNALLTAWWDAADVETLLRTFVRTLRSRGRAVLRLLVPSGLLVDGRVPSGDLAAQLPRLVLDVPDPATAGVIRDAATWQSEGVVIVGTETPILERVALDPRGHTVITQTGGDTDRVSDPLDLGGRLTMREWSIEPLWTPGMLTLQKALNLAYTMASRNVVQGGFLERIILNAQLPGRYVREHDGTNRFVLDPLYVGAGTTNALMGAPITDTMGNVTGYTTPSVVYRDPSPIDVFEGQKQMAYAGILGEAQQMHALLSGAAGVSSESRRQALADYENSLMLTAPIIRSAVAWLLETALAWASALARRPILDVRADVQVRLSLGPLTQADADLATTLHGAGLWSRQRAMAYTHVEDTDAEMAIIAASADTAPAGTGSTATIPQGGDTV
jgi:hypothetical protein